MSLTEWNMEYGVPIISNYSVKCVQTTPKTYQYTIFNNNKCIGEFESKAPSAITPRHNIGMQLMNIISEKYDDKKSKRHFKTILRELNSFVVDYKNTQELIDRAEQFKEEQEENDAIEKALDWFGSINDPVLWLASSIDWLTAGERCNILKVFVAYCSQIILKHPISIIGLGEGSSGKDHVRGIARHLCPQEFFLDEKQPTLPSMFHRSENNQYYYDGKIVCYGDMGGENDQDEVRETKNILKEMQTDGYVNRPITLKTENGFEVVDLELYGFPCLDFGTVPNYTADSQELSRSLTFTPRTDNRYEFFEMKHLLELKGSPISNKHEQFKEELFGRIPLVVKGLRRMFDDIEIINPYTRNIEEFVGDTEYFKRDYDKFNNLLKVIACFNYNTKEIFEINGVKTMFVTKYDLALFFSLFHDHMASISNNLNPKSMEIIEDLTNLFDEIVGEVIYDHPDDEGISVNEYLERGNIKISKRSLQKYFKELNEQGYLKIIGNYARSNLYALTDKNITVGANQLALAEQSIAQLCHAYPQNICDHIRSDLTPTDCSIFEQHEDIVKPTWCRDGGDV